MDSCHRSSEQRQSFRFQVPEGRNKAVLRVGDRQVPVWLFNESAGGFAAWAEDCPGIKNNDLGELFSIDGRFEVRVVYVAESRVADAEGEDGVKVFRLGLQRVRELEPRAGKRGQAHDKLPPLPSQRSRISTVTWAALVIAATLMGALTVLCNLDNPTVRWFAQWKRAAHGPLPPEALDLAAMGPGSDLTAQQKKEIDAVAQSVSRAFQEFDAEWTNDPPQERARKQALAIEAAQQEIKRRLSDEQWQRWKAPLE